MRNRILWTTMLLLMAGQAQSQETASPRFESRQRSLPKAFLAVDTTRLMGSPSPVPLETRRVFSQLFLEQPVELTHAGDGSNRLFVLERRGVIRVFENREDVSGSAVFLDIRDRTLSEGNEEGLLGLAFHPNFRKNGEFFVYYSARPRSTVVSRFRLSRDQPTVADPKSEERLLQIPQPYDNHKGGSLRFGPDGYLYVGLGDGGLANDPHGNGQNLNTLLAKILRLDVDHQDPELKYSIPKDNPFAERKDARGEIWAYGFRNVWRMAFDRKTGDLWSGDVGQDRFEEINLVRRGGNYGWNLREGFHSLEPTSPAKPVNLIDPVAEYFRGEGQSVTGGMVYRGPALKSFQGAYFYGDHISGHVWILRWDGSKVTERRKVASTGIQISAFGEDERGEMYLCDLNGGIYRLQPRPGDREAIARAFPRKLSETRLFASVKDHQPAEGLIPYPAFPR